jgi:hypothetical protein
MQNGTRPLSKPYLLTRDGVGARRWRGGYERVYTESDHVRGILLRQRPRRFRRPALAVQASMLARYSYDQRTSPFTAAIGLFYRGDSLHTPGWCRCSDRAVGQFLVEDCLYPFTS